MKNDTLVPAWFRYPAQKYHNKKAIVIGGGIAGCQSAWHLLQAGWEVTLIERERTLASQASGNPAGIISPKMTAKTSVGETFYRHCFEYVIEQFSELQNQDQTLEWHHCGLLQLAHNVRETQRWQALQARKDNLEFDDDFIQLLDAKQSNHIAGIDINHAATYFPQAGWINPKSFCDTLTCNHPSEFTRLLNSNVLTLIQEDHSWQVLDSNSKYNCHADVVIVCNGKDLHQLTADYLSADQLPTQGVAGQTTVATASDYSRPLKTAIGHEGYLTPAPSKTNQHTFGASFDRNDTQPKLNPKIDQQNLKQLAQYLPELSNSWSDIQSAHVAVRMTTPDRFPYVGGIPDRPFYFREYDDLHQGKHFKHYPEAQYIKGLYVLAGLGSRGLTTSALCAKLLVDAINNDVKDENPHNAILQHCHPARFLIKALKRKQ